MNQDINSRLEEYIFLLEIMLELKQWYPMHLKDVLNEEIVRYQYMIELEEKKLCMS